ncbi:cation:proton antiporter [Streptomyces aidingensis]|uniref:Kef-type K+ transport system, membrane component KefB n=1 Tax=Streptomyces aidingensis TaxID=910347 RepID=A0A1I1HCB7_9ACTN|nr:cation:proton antiporter [Streptomyces aidingensis]SFC19113.1 Kef-type K+ transport system, membrane component KefB [Streptomyces aidingensis]
MTPAELAPAFFLAAVVILVACRLVALAVGRFGQPPVVGEMITGVLLGPSLFGLLAPGVSAHVFPPDLKPVLYVAGQIGLVALMFQAGYAFRTHAAQAGRGLAGTTAAVSAAGVLAPLLLGAALVLAVHGRSGIFTGADDVSVWVIAAFVGVALAVTAFPMLARIITERGLAGSRHGSLAMASGATDDAVAWILLAGVVSLASGQARPVLTAVGGSALFLLLLFTLGRRLLAWAATRPGLGDETRLLVTVGVLFSAAWFTDVIELYAVFGAFCTGLAMPRAPASERMVRATQPMTQTVFVPMFFVYSGLNTDFGVFADPGTLAFGAAAVVLAVLGKFGGCWAAARLRGEPAGVALRIGALMNARGLMQLIALNIGLEAGIVGRELFTALVLVALVTTVMTVPMLNRLDRRDARSRPPAPGDAPPREAGPAAAVIT